MSKNPFFIPLRPLRSLRPLCFLLLLHCAFVTVYAQSPAREIETLLAADAVTYAQAARVILDAANVLTTQDHKEAFDYALNQKWLPKKTAPDQKARLDAVSLLCMRSFNIKGGLFYTLTKNAHYSYRELVYLNVIQGRTAPSTDVSGDLLLFMVGRILGAHDRQRAQVQGAEQRRTRLQRDIAAYRESLAERINTMLAEQEVADTTVEVTSEGVVITMSNIQFLADSAELQESEKKKIQGVAGILKNIPDIKLLVAGHAARAGAESALLVLSLERARSVANYLVELEAVEAGNVTAAGFGAERPVADNATPEGMAANRRVEITILEQQ